jgi:hypothetical protein
MGLPATNRSQCWSQILAYENNEDANKSCLQRNFLARAIPSVTLDKDLKIADLNTIFENKE